MRLALAVLEAELKLYRKAIRLAALATVSAVAEAKRQATRAETAERRVKALEEYIRSTLRPK